MPGPTHRAYGVWDHFFCAAGLLSGVALQLERFYCSLMPTVSNRSPSLLPLTVEDIPSVLEIPLPYDWDLPGFLPQQAWLLLFMFLPLRYRKQMSSVYGQHHKLISLQRLQRRRGITRISWQSLCYFMYHFFQWLSNLWFLWKADTAPIELFILRQPIIWPSLTPCRAWLLM